MPNSLLSSIIACKCPVCRKGNMFEHQSLAPSKFVKMHTNCSVCNFKFEREPAFFSGAMYVSYAFSVAILITVFVALNILGGPPLWVYFTTVGVLVTLCVPVSYRYSRVLYLYMFGDYEYKPNFGK